MSAPISPVAKRSELRRYESWLRDPLKFCKMCWPNMRLYDKQQEILLSVRDNIETYVHAANEMGKDFISSIIVIWFFCSRKPAKVLTTSSSEDQLEGVLWEEMKERIATSEIDLGLIVDHLRIRRKDRYNHYEALSFVKGKVAKKGESFQGFHLPEWGDVPRVLTLIDEASGVDDTTKDSCDSFSDRVLIIGNPLNNRNFFYRGCKEGNQEDPAGGPGLLRKVIHIGAEHSPNVRLARKQIAAGEKPSGKTLIPGLVTYADFLRRDKKWDKPKKVRRLGGHFYEGADSLLFPPDWLDLAEIVYKLLPSHRRGLAMGIDTGAGRDLTCWTIIDWWGIIKQFAIPTPDTSVITGKTISFIREYQIPPGRVCFDYGGGGKQIADHIRAQGITVRSVLFGERASQRKPPKSSKRKEAVLEERMVFKNRRAEMYWLTREMFDRWEILSTETPKELITTCTFTREDGSTGVGHVFGISEDMPELRQELAILPLQYDHEGQLFLPPKDARPSGTKTGNIDNQITLRSLLGRSPDRSDSLALAVYALRSGPQVEMGSALF